MEWMIASSLGKPVYLDISRWGMNNDVDPLMSLTRVRPCLT